MKLIIWYLTLIDYFFVLLKKSSQTNTYPYYTNNTAITVTGIM